MGLASALEAAERIEREAGALLNGLSLIPTKRRRLAGGALLIALDIQGTITAAIRHRHYPSAFILSRSIWEAMVRGFWLLECAEEEQLDRFENDKLNMKTFEMIKSLESAGSADASTLSHIHSSNWKRLNAMNHVGGPLVVRCNSEDGVAYNFDPDELVECLNHASSIALLSGMGVAQAAVNTEVCHALFRLQTELFPHRQP